MRKPVTLIVVTAVAVVAVVMLARAFDGPEDRDGSVMGRDGATAMLSAADVAMVVSAAEAGSAEVDLAQLAQTTSEHPGVDTLAAQLERDHKQVNDRLKDLADRKDVDFPDDVVGLPGPNEAQRATHERLDALEGAVFDRAWVDQMVTNHQAGIDLYTRASQSTDADLKALAEATLPSLRAHLQACQDLQRRLTESAR